MCIFWMLVCQSVKNPSSAKIEAIQMHKFSIGPVAYLPHFQMIIFIGKFGQKFIKRTSKFFRRKHTLHIINYDQTRRKKIVTAGFPSNGAVFIIEIQISSAIINQFLQFNIADSFGIIIRKSEPKSSVCMFTLTDRVIQFW